MPTEERAEERSGYRNANVGGLYTKMIPPHYSALPQDKIEIIWERFGDDSAFFKHGMYMARLRDKEAYYMRVCAGQQTGKTAVAKSFYLHAEMLPLRDTDFFDNNLDALIHYRFPSEEDIVNNLEVIDASEGSVTAYPLDSKLLISVLFGCMTRWKSKAEPIYIAIPDNGENNEGFDTTVYRVRRAIYEAMPYALRAHAGYMTYPVPGKTEEFISICFLPESRKNFYREPILRLNPLLCEREMQEILTRSKLDDALVRYIQYTVEHPEKRESLNELFYKIERKGSNGDWASLPCRLYGEAFDFDYDWDNLLATEKDNRIRKRALEPKSELDEIIWDKAEKHLNSEETLQSSSTQEEIHITHFAWLLWRISSGVRTFSDFAANEELESWHPVVAGAVARDIVSLKQEWEICLREFTKTVCYRAKKDLDFSLITDFGKARTLLVDLFVIDSEQLSGLSVEPKQPSGLFDELDDIVGKVYQWMVGEQKRLGLLTIQKKTVADCRAGFAGFCVDLVNLFSGFVDENKNDKDLLEAAQSRANEILRQACTDDSRDYFRDYEKLYKTYSKCVSEEAYRILWSSALVQAWEAQKLLHQKYERAQKILESYFEWVANVGLPIRRSDHWSPLEYMTAFCRFIRHHSELEELSLINVYKQADKDALDLFNKPISFEGMINGIKKLRELFRQCVYYEAFGGINIALDASHSITSGEAERFLDQLLAGDLLTPTDIQLRFSGALAQNGLLTPDQAKLICLSGGHDYIAPEQVLIARIMALPPYEVDDTLEWLCSTHDKGRLKQHKTLFITGNSIGRNIQNQTKEISDKLTDIWDRKFKEVKPSKVGKKNEGSVEASRWEKFWNPKKAHLHEHRKAYSSLAAVLIIVGVVLAIVYRPEPKPPEPDPSSNVTTLVGDYTEAPTNDSIPALDFTFPTAPTEPEGISVDMAYVVVRAGTTFIAEALNIPNGTSFTMESSDSDVASSVQRVEGKTARVIKAKKDGEVTISVTAKGETIATFKVKVLPADGTKDMIVDGIGISKSEIRIPRGTTTDLFVTILPTNTENIEFEVLSQVPAITSIQGWDVSSGKITVLGSAIGSTKIVIKTKDGGYSAECEVTVY